MEARMTNYLSDEEMRVAANPGILFALRNLPLDRQREIARDVRQFRRAENGDRFMPEANNPLLTDELRKKNPAWAHGLPMPFAPRETHRPDRAANPEVMQYLREANGRLEAEQATDALQQRMGTDQDRPLDPPTLRDQIEAAATLHSSEE